MEKYGTVPKKFTKAWWEYFWEYYKIHVIAVCVVGSMIGITAYQFITNPEHDVTVTYVGTSLYQENSHEKIQNELVKIIDDVDGNNKKSVFFQSIDEVSPVVEVEAPQFRMGFMMKKNFEYQTGETYLFLMDKKELDSHFMNDADAYGFILADEWLEDKNAKRAEGKASRHFVKLSDTDFLDEFGFSTDGVYMGIYELREDQKYAEKRQAEAIKIANYILNY